MHELHDFDNLNQRYFNQIVQRPKQSSTANDMLLTTLPILLGLFMVRRNFLNPKSVILWAIAVLCVEGLHDTWEAHLLSTMRAILLALFIVRRRFIKMKFVTLLCITVYCVRGYYDRYESPRDLKALRAGEALCTFG